MFFFSLMFSHIYLHSNVNKRNLVRLMKEKHSDKLLHFKCVISGCNSKFIRRSYLTKHLKLVNKLDNQTAEQLAMNVVLEGEDTVMRAPLSESCVYKDTHPYEDDQ